MGGLGCRLHRDNVCVGGGLLCVPEPRAATAAPAGGGKALWVRALTWQLGRLLEPPLWHAYTRAAARGAPIGAQSRSRPAPVKPWQDDNGFL